MFFAMGVGAVTFLVLARSSGLGPEEERQKGVLKQLAAEIQPYAASRPLGERFYAKANRVSFRATYETYDDFNKVREFYHQQLTSKAWVKEETQQAVGPHENNTYRKREYKVTVYPNETPKPGFVLVFEWDRP